LFCQQTNTRDITGRWLKILTDKKGEMMTLNPLSKRLKQFIREFKMNQEEMAATLGISRRSLYSAMNPDKDVDSVKEVF
jgi:DNA-binding XRE family transcriptional regulator